MRGSLEQMGRLFIVTAAIRARDTQGWALIDCGEIDAEAAQWARMFARDGIELVNEGAGWWFKWVGAGAEMPTQPKEEGG